MTAPSEHEAYLRRALHAAADSLEPRDDGLERITARLRHARPKAVVWLTAAWDALRLRAPAGLQDAFYRLTTGLWAAWDALQRHAPTALHSAFSSLSAALWAAWDRFTPGSAPGKHRSSDQGWLRPLAAMAVVMFIVAAGTYVAINISTAVSPSSTNLHPPSGKPGPGHSGSAPASTPSRSGLGSGTGLRSPSTSPTCSPSPTPQPSGSVPASPSANPSPTPTDTPSSPGPSASTAVVSAVQLTSVTEVSSTQAKASLTPCPTPSTGSQTPNPSTDAGTTQANQAGAALVPQPSASPAVKSSGKHRIHP